MCGRVLGCIEPYPLQHADIFYRQMVCVHVTCPSMLRKEDEIL